MLHTGKVSDEVPPDDFDAHVQWAIDPSGRRYWVQAVPSFGGNPLAPVVRALKARLLGRPRVTQTDVEVGGVVMVTRVDGAVETDVLLRHRDTLAEARAEAMSTAEKIEAGTFREHPPSGR